MNLISIEKILTSLITIYRRIEWRIDHRLQHILPASHYNMSPKRSTEGTSPHCLGVAPRARNASSNIYSTLQLVQSTWPIWGFYTFTTYLVNRASTANLQSWAIESKLKENFGIWWVSISDKLGEEIVHLWLIGISIPRGVHVTRLPNQTEKHAQINPLTAQSDDSGSWRQVSTLHTRFWRVKWQVFSSKTAATGPARPPLQMNPAPFRFGDDSLRSDNNFS